MTQENDAPQVLVVGAGPVGLTVAHELLRRGVRVRLVDAAPGPARTSRALATHARTLETYDQMGLLERLQPRGRRVQAFTLHQDGTVLTRLGTDYSHLPTRFPYTVMIDQVITEEVLRTAVEELGGRVEWGVRLESLSQRDDAVGVRLRGPDDAVTELTVPWLVGCDGGHSTVRRCLGLRLVGSSSETWLIADATVDADVPQDSIHWVRTRRGTVMLVPFPEPGRWRLLDTAEADHADDPDVIGARFSTKLSAGLGRPVRVQRPTWVSVFTIQQRMIEQMRVGRCFVAGDAAHVHSPASGQGMNTGIQDGYNLAWKLAMVVAGRADATMLDSYPAERVPIGRVLLGSTRKATAAVQLRNPVLGTVLPLVVRLVNRVPALRGRVQRKIMGEMSALGVSYPGSPLTMAADPGPGPAPGGRVAQVTAAGALDPGWAQVLAELRDPRWSLLVGEAAVRAVAELPADVAAWLSVRTVVASSARVDTAGAAEGTGGAEAARHRPLPDPAGRVRADLGLGPRGWLLVRPDGYLAARGDDFSAGSVTGAIPGVGVARSASSAV
ncbi:FAD-dependent oxidoreductase [Micromonospora wenchangensis]